MLNMVSTWSIHGIYNYKGPKVDTPKTSFLDNIDSVLKKNQALDGVEVKAKDGLNMVKTWSKHGHNMQSRHFIHICLSNS